ncbi:MAG: hypothetical protein ACM33V_07355 [Chloroflexota bacterium]|nr:hypothetical protein [Anaerolineales bacterium]
MKRWQGSCIGALLVLLIGGSSLLFFVPFGGAMIAAAPPLFDRLTAYVLCPDATDYSYNDYGFGAPTSSSPSGGTGHYTELTCTYADGSQKVFENEEVGLKGLAASFTAAAICGGAAVLALMTLAGMIGGRLVKPK